MARIRTIKPEFWEDEKLGQLPVLARLTFAGLICQADDEGRGRGSTAGLRRVLHGFARDVTEEQMTAALAELEAGGFVRFYDDDGQRYYVLKNFTKHQYIAKRFESKFPAPPPQDKSKIGTGGQPEPSRSSTGPLPDDSQGIGREGTGSEGTGPDRIREVGAGPPSATAPGDRPQAPDGGTELDLKYPATFYSREELEQRRAHAKAAAKMPKSGSAK
jgi:hypothetical protein